MKKIVINLLLILPTYVSAQESINSAGGDIIGDTYIFSYSIGQVFYTTINDGNHNVAQGVQQIYLGDGIGITENNSDEIHLSVFPNPFIEHITIAFDNEITQPYSYELTDVSGRLVKKGAITEHITKVEVNHLSTANYYITVKDKSNKSIKTFKLIKF